MGGKLVGTSQLPLHHFSVAVMSRFFRIRLDLCDLLWLNYVVRQVPGIGLLLGFGVG
jgi:hypothetical protein